MGQAEILVPDVFGLTGGIGSGKSTVSAEYASRGAVVLDADQIVEDLQQPGEAGLLGMVSILGDEIIDDSGELNRPATGKLIFGDPEKRKAIENLLHPMVWQRMEDGISQATPGGLVILDVPLLLEHNRRQLLGTIVVDTPVDMAVQRKVAQRSRMTEADVRARIAQQISREERLRLADYVISNDSSQEELLEQIELSWQWMESTRALGRLAVTNQGGNHE
jgi:dephospho-CoA kinase